MLSPRKKVTEVTDRIKAEVGKAGDAVRAALAVSVLALVISVIALVIGARPRHAG